MSDEGSGAAGGREPGDGEAERQEPGHSGSGGCEPGRGGEAARAEDPARAQDPDRGEEPARLLDEMRALRRRARTARHAYWFPLVLFGLLTCAAAPFYVQWGNPGTGAVSSGGVPFAMLGGFSGMATERFLGYYWLAALLFGLLLTLLWYRWNARRVGLQTPARGYIVTTAVLAVLALVIPPLSEVNGLHFLFVLWPGDLVVRGTFPFVIIAVGLWVLARAERSRALCVIAAVYTGTALLSALYNDENVLFRLGWSPTGWQWRLTTLPNVLVPAFVLLIAGAGAFAAQRYQARPRA